MRLLELFSGTKSVSKAAKSLGWETVSLDIDPTHGPDLLQDIADFDPSRYPKDYFDYVWASPDCRAYSNARSKAKIPVEEAMQASDPLLEKTREIIAYFDKAKWCIENPAFSRIWKRGVADGLLEQSVVTSYCCFDFPYRKNTRLASNYPLVLPRCPGPGKCPQMVGTKHPSWVNSIHPEVSHRIPPALCESILKQAADHMALQ
jgi:hypothetical protein